MLIDDLSKLPDSFKDGFRGVLLLFRQKDGQTGNQDRKAIKTITSSKEQWEQAVKDFNHMRSIPGLENHRIYSSVNERDFCKVVREFKRRQLDADYEDDYKFYTDIKNRFFSCFMTPASKLESNFLFDCDDQESYDKHIERIPKELVIFEYQTKNGFHIITKPFNWHECKIDEPKKDDLLAIG